MKLLLHCCCGPCSLAVIETLRNNSVQKLDTYFYNPNIQPYLEYQARRAAWQQAMEHCAVKAHLNDAYTLEGWLQAVAQNPKNRCAYCYESRLRQTAIKSKELGFDASTTTLLISPYQKHEDIKLLGEQIAAAEGLIFYYQDFRPSFWTSQQTAREMGLYMQKYCGCIYSEKERYCKGL